MVVQQQIDKRRLLVRLVERPRVRCVEPAEGQGAGDGRQASRRELHERTLSEKACRGESVHDVRVGEIVRRCDGERVLDGHTDVGGLVLGKTGRLSLLGFGHLFVGSGAGSGHLFLFKSGQFNDVSVVLLKNVSGWAVSA